MTDKERLMNLILDLEYNTNGTLCDGCGGRPVSEAAQDIAVHLLSNGVTLPKRGHWIIKSNGHGANATNWAECSECHVCGSPQWKVCPVCETRMEQHSAINIEEVDFDYAAEDDNA